MKRLTHLATLASLILFTGVCQATIPENLVKSGSGEIRYLGFIKVYEAELFVPPGTAREQLLLPQTSRCLRLEYAVGLTAENFVEAAETVLRRQHTPDFLDSIWPEIEELHRNYLDVEANDTYTLCHDAQSGVTSLALNDNVLVAIASPEFSRAYFGIWLDSQKPLDENLRRSLTATLNER